MTDKRKLHDALAGIRAILPAENESAEPTDGILWLILKLQNAASGWATVPPAEILMAAAAKELERLTAAPSADLTELRALVEKTRNRPHRRGTDYLQGWVDGESRLADELEALIERLEK